MTSFTCPDRPVSLPRSTLLRAALLVWLGSLTGQAQTPSAAPLPNVFWADPQVMAESKAKLAAGDVSLKPVLDRLLDDANNALTVRPPSVMDKHRTPPSGDKHDYISQAPYYWRDTNSPDGRYIRRDGERNPESRIESDAGRLGGVCADVHTLALAYYFTGNENYAKHAVNMVWVWFLDPATRMNPNLNFGQGIPGQTTGRAAGLIGARGLVQLVDGLQLLSGSKAWTSQDREQMVAWVNDYLTWLTTSKIGLGESNATNNHGTWYDTQAVALALYVGKTNLAKQILENARQKRIAGSIEPDGREPRELQRTSSFGYSMFNLRALEDLASLCQNLGIDLWHYQTADGRSIRKVLEFMSPYADSSRKWPYQEIRGANRQSVAGALMRAAPHYPDNKFSQDLKFFDSDELATSRDRLLFRIQLPSQSLSKS